MKTVLVTGGAGFIGSHLCDALLSLGRRVVCLDNFESNYPRSIKEGNIEGAIQNKNFILVESDIGKKEGLEKIFLQNRIDYVFHLAARTGVRASVEEPAPYFDTNVRGTINVLDMCVRHKIKRIVFASSSSVYGRVKVPFSEEGKTIPASPYGASKLAAENMCRIYHNIHGLNAACLRFFTVYGPRGRPDMAPYIFTDRIEKGESIKIFGDGSSMRDYTYVKDIIEGVIKAAELDSGFEVINIGSSNPIRLLDFVSVVERILGRKANPEFENEQVGDMKATYADIAKAQKTLGFRPKVNIEQGMKIFADWYREKCAA